MSRVQEVPPRTGHRLWISAVCLVIVAIVAGVAISIVSYRESRSAVHAAVARECFAVAQSIGRDVVRRGVPSDKPAILAALDTAWKETVPAYPGSYLCAIERPGTIALHTKKPSMQGASVASVVLDPKSKQPKSVASLLEQCDSWHGSNVNLRGMRQLIGYHYESALDLLIAVHVPATLVDETIAAVAGPWLWGLGIIGLLVLPLAIGLSFVAALRAQSSVRTMAQSLTESERIRLENLDLLEHVYNTSPLGLCLVDLDLKYMRVNTQLAAIDNIPPDKYLGRTVSEVVPDLSDRLTPTFQKVIETGSLVEISVDLPDSTGETNHYVASYTPLRAADGEIQGVSTVVQDVTTWRRMELALRESEERFRSLCVGAPVGIFLCTEDGRCSYANPACCELLGVEVDGLNGVDWELKLHPDDRSRVRRSWNKAIEENRDYEDQFRFGDDDGRTVWVDASLSVQDSGDDSVGYIGTLVDITDRLRSERERIQLQAELLQAQKLEAVGTLASGVAHDFNNLVMAIQGHVDLARRALPSDHETQRSIDIISSAADQAAGVSQSLLTFCHRTPVHRAAVKFDELIRDSLNMLRRLIPAAIELTHELPDESVWVMADRVQLQQVVLNLTINARDAMDHGGVLTVSLEQGEDEQGANCVLRIRDNGVGMSEETLSRIFEPFFTTKSRQQGTGLGMSIVRSMVSDHGGHISVDSQVGVGTCVQVTLPTCVAQETDGDSEDVRLLEITGQGKVLIAEDNDFVRELLVEALGNYGYETIAAPDGTRCMEEFDRHDDLALVILDLDLPEKSGADCYDEIRATRPGFPVLIITGGSHSRKFDSDTTLLTKPFDLFDLVRTVDSLLESVGEKPPSL